MARRYKFERVLEEIRRCSTKKEAYENLGLSKRRFYTYMQEMQKLGMLDENYNIIEEEV